MACFVEDEVGVLLLKSGHLQRLPFNRHALTKFARC